MSGWYAETASRGSSGSSTVATKGFFRGTHRLVPPGETLSRARRLFAPLGITRVANVTGLDCIGIPVVMVCRPNARSLAVAQGKGIELDAAKASGVMETIELYHAERTTLPLKIASWNELRFSHNLIDVESIPRLSVSAFHRDRTLPWIAGMDLFTSAPVWLPYEIVHTNFTVPPLTGSGCFVMSSNGLASGNHPLEAIVHGLCEVIERDATTLFHCRGAEARDAARVDLATVSDPECRRVLDLYERARVSVGVWDVTSDIGVPAFLCEIADREESVFRHVARAEGMGCHLVREVALIRALTEAAQARLTLITGSRDDNGRGQYAQAPSRDFMSGVRRRLLRSGTRRFNETPTQLNDTLEGDVAALLTGLRVAGLGQAVVVDLTKPEFDISVARVVVPGLETYHHISAGVPGQRARRVLDATAKEREW